MSSVPLTYVSYSDRKRSSNEELDKALMMFNITEGDFLVLDHFLDNSKTSLSSIPWLLRRFRPQQIYTANIGMNPLGSTEDSRQVVKLAQDLGVHAEEIEILSYMKTRLQRTFSGGYLDFCCSLATAKDAILTFVGNHLDVSRDAVVAFTVEINRTMHRKEKSSNAELIRDFIFGEFKASLPYTFCDPMIYFNMGDISNHMQFVIVKLSVATLPHHSHLALNPRDRTPHQVVYRGPHFEKEIMKPVVPTPYDWSDLRVVLPEGCLIADEIPVPDHPLLETTVKKTFHGRPYIGKVVRAYNVEGRFLRFYVKYEDNDAEEMSVSEVRRFKVKRMTKWPRRKIINID